MFSMREKSAYSPIRANRFRNWSRNVVVTPAEIVYPASIEEVQQLVRTCYENGHYLRVVGSGHSFTPVASSDQILVSLDRMQGIIAIDKQSYTAEVWGGTKLKWLGQLLHEQGLAQENLGDIDVQSIAGAISTGTHGTGVTFGTIATQVIGLTVVNGQGEVIECSEQSHPELFKALQISLGMLGIIVQVTLRLQSSYIMKYESKRMKLADCLPHLEQYANSHRHFEIYWFPYAETCQVKMMNESDTTTKATPVKDYIKGRILENALFGLLSALCRVVPSISSTASKISAAGIPIVSKADYSYRLFATVRNVRFLEMEYNVPAELLPVIIKEMRGVMKAEKFHVHFPIECRYVAADDIWLSPAFERDSAYIAVHMYKGMPYERYFAKMEQIFKRYQGRPHWGKMHTLQTDDLQKLYPKWDAFREVRKVMDAKGIFLSPYLRRLVGE
ncbi:D-arabinono-1,4-lactone oxidase [Paenibacillus yanchengensis]|uniref:D-arabinono-1,4-lactone oxidase n=1 Tax=Paenibacillus yanchengensis TaxID=2035833 RepID=A0ABW4YQ69_9BACL